MAIRFIQQDEQTLREAFAERKQEYDALRRSGNWAGARLACQFICL